MKKCETCELEKDDIEFARKRNSCKRCRSKNNYDNFRLNNPEKMKSYRKKYYDMNRDKIMEMGIKYYEENKEHLLEGKKKYTENNREKICLHKREKYRDDVDYRNRRLEYNKK